MPKFNAPEPMSFDAPAKWPEWKERFARFRIATKLHKDDGEVQVASLVYAMGRQAENIFKSFTFDPPPAPTDADPNPLDPKDNYDVVLKKYDAYFVPKRNTIYERAKFYQRTQEPGESIECFVRNLHELAANCRFEERETENIRDRLISGMSDKEMSLKLQLEQDDLTLVKAVEMARHKEMVKAQNETKVDAVRKPYPNKSTSAGPPKNQGGQGGGPPKMDGSKCSKCGYVHRTPRCPADGKRCNSCKGWNHFSSVCNKKTAVEDLEVRDEGSGDEGEGDQRYFLGAVECPDSDPAWFVELDVNGNPVKWKLDSGADVSVMSQETFKKMRERPELKPISIELLSLGGAVKPLGQFIAKTKFKGTKYSFRVIVVPKMIDCLMSRSVACRMGLIKKIENVEVFQGLGCLKTQPVKILLRDDAQPYALSVARRVPIPLLPKIKEELEKLESEGIIEKITRPTAWCAPMVPVTKKSGKVRLCVDLKKLNLSVKRERYVLPTLEDVTSKLSGASVFSSLDATSGFYQIPLEEGSCELTTFITPFGRYCFRRLPFGITSAPEIFMRKMNEVLDGLEGTFAYMDDVLVYGNDREEHDKRLESVMKRLREVDLKLNKEKCVFAQSKLKFLGHKFTKSGIEPDGDKVSAILEMPEPTSVPLLRQIMGMVHYLGAYLPNLHDITKPLNDLLRSDTVWLWEPAQQEAFNKMKELVSSAQALAYYDVHKPTVVSADASSYGLGGVLLQDHDGQLRPVAYCSRTLSSAEQRYAQIEKECLAGVWACEKFDRFLCGLEGFKILTDHKPLVTLINEKDLDRAPLRCQRLLMRMHRYNATAEYAPGKTMVISDALSRSPRSCVETTCDKEVKVYVGMVEENLPMTDHRKEGLRRATHEDDVLRAACVYTLAGWPKYEQDVPTQLRELFGVRGSLSVSNGLLTYGDRIIVPKDMRPAILDKIHQGHQGIGKCLERAKDSVWWPGIAGDVKSIVASCDHCQTFKPSQRKEPLVTTPLPDLPWQRIGVDLCQFERHEYLVMVDYHSRWIEILHLTTTTSSAVIAKMKDVFARLGLPQEVFSDNGPQFVSEQFRQFAKKCDFNHITSSPHLPNSNGEAERAVKTAKSVLRQEDPWLALMIYRDTVIAATGCSPSQLMMGRHLRTNLPTLGVKLRPSLPNPDVVKDTDKATKLGYQHYYNARHGVRSLPDLQPGDVVKLKTDQEKSWATKGIVTATAESPRSYIVQSESGVYRRNRRHLQTTADTEQSLPIPAPTTAPTTVQPDHTAVVSPPSPAPVTPQLRRSSRTITKPDRLIES